MKYSLVIALMITALTWGGWTLVDEPLPAGSPGPESEALADEVLAAIHYDAWRLTGVVEWTFAGKREHLWDRQRHWARVQWDDYTVWVDLTLHRGCAERDGHMLDAEQVQPLVEKAWAFWANDSFWLNPLAKVRDSGTERSLVNLGDGRRGLLVSYRTGGVTPGDSYLWAVDADGQVQYGKMWVQVFPLGGMRFDWFDWIELATGARIALQHDGPIAVDLSEVRAAYELSELYPQQDPFLLLEDRIGSESAAR